MKILIVSEQKRYTTLVTELRKKHHVDYLYHGTKWNSNKCDYEIPRVFGKYLCFSVLATLLTHYLLLTRRYDYCLTDYISSLRPLLIALLPNCINRTRFVYDVRTIPVGYNHKTAKSVQRRFFTNLRFANSFYQGISLITTRMKTHIQKNYLPLAKPLCIWGSGVNTSIFKPLPKNMALKRELGFNDNDFVCFYHGSISKTRGIIDLIDAILRFQGSSADIKLLLLGTISRFDDTLQEINERTPNPLIKLREWVDYSVVPEFISISDLCIVPLPDIEWWRVSSPLKLMEYIACGKNILLSDISAHTDILGKKNGCYWVSQVTPESLAYRIEGAHKSFITNPESYYRQGLELREILLNDVSIQSRVQILLDFFSGLSEVG